MQAWRSSEFARMHAGSGLSNLCIRTTVAGDCRTSSSIIWSTYTLGTCPALNIERALLLSSPHSRVTTDVQEIPIFSLIACIALVITMLCWVAMQYYQPKTCH